MYRACLPKYQKINKIKYFNVPKFSEITILKHYKANVGTVGKKVIGKSLTKLLARNIAK